MLAACWAAFQPANRLLRALRSSHQFDPDPRAVGYARKENVDVMTKGRHDPCVGIRAVPVGEAMMACVLADHLLRHRGQVGDYKPVVL